MTPNQILTEKWTEDPQSTDELQKCQGCLRFEGVMNKRRVEDRNGDAHKEYRVICRNCGHEGQIHWSRRLAVHSWNAETTPVEINEGR